MQSYGIRWYNRTMQPPTAVLQKSRRSGDVAAETTVQAYAFAGGFLVQQTTLLRRARDGARLQADVSSWHLADSSQLRDLVSRLEGSGFRPPPRESLLERLAAALFDGVC